MPELVEQMYCSQQIVIPPKFPYILKRYCKAAIKTQPYDLLRWSFEYFKALAEHRPPPVKLRLEYPVYSTEGGLTRGCLKVLAHQLSSRKHLPLPLIKAAWQGFCLDPCELKRVICLCEAYLREETIPFLHFIAVAGGLLTKSLTHTMILLCETLTKEPDGGSAAIPLDDFLTMYTFLARMDASKDVRYIDGYREGHTPKPETTVEEEAEYEGEQVDEESCSDDFWLEGCRQELHKLDLIDDRMSRTARLSVRLNMPVLGKIERSPSIERAGQIERENYLRDRKGRAQPDGDVEAKLRDMSSSALPSQDAPKEGMVAGRQMSTTSGEFIVQHIEREIMEYIDEQIAILPDPDLKKKKAKPEEVEMIRNLLETFLDENMDIIVPEVEEVEEEELPIPNIAIVYAVPGIGPPVPEDMIADVEEYALDVSKVQAEVFMPRNIRHFMCPPLEQFEEYKYGGQKKEELATGGMFTD
ncbi:uncharacterized protein isoform X3 [Choristoneura fumiferana]|uniref:uncharacterized protein isoform X3 n=1 Tax=Choristoneura fumiferana TaxID=7141 RepID=UPI003D157CE7